MTVINRSTLRLDKPAHTAKVRTITLTAEALLGLFMQDGSQVLSFSGIPYDATVVGVRVDEQWKGIYLDIQSDAFEEETEGIMRLVDNRVVVSTTVFPEGFLDWYVSTEKSRETLEKLVEGDK